MTTKIDGKPMWTDSPSGKMMYGKEVKKDIKERYQKDNLNEEIKFLKKIVKAQTRLLTSYRLGKTPPEWVFDTIDKAHKIYGGSLDKIS